MRNLSLIFLLIFSISCKPSEPESKLYNIFSFISAAKGIGWLALGMAIKTGKLSTETTLATISFAESLALFQSPNSLKNLSKEKLKSERFKNSAIRNINCGLIVLNGILIISHNLEKWRKAPVKGKIFDEFFLPIANIMNMFYAGLTAAVFMQKIEENNRKLSEIDRLLAQKKN